MSKQYEHKAPAMSKRTQKQIDEDKAKAVTPPIVDLVDRAMKLHAKRVANPADDYSVKIGQLLCLNSVQVTSSQRRWRAPERVIARAKRIGNSELMLRPLVFEVLEVRNEWGDLVVKFRTEDRDTGEPLTLYFRKSGFAFVERTTHDRILSTIHEALQHELEESLLFLDGTYVKHPHPEELHDGPKPATNYAFEGYKLRLSYEPAFGV